NRFPYEDGWMIRIEMSDESEVDGLLEADEYKSYIEEEND
ncbi:MAG: glycine cleavage system protein H, partial [bacterium]